MQLTLILLALPVTSACYPSGDALTVYKPSFADFQPVADAMQPSCGTLDCHGQVGRNLRLYGGQGLRLGQANPIADPTAPAEYQASYRSVVGLEPEALHQLIDEGGSDLERLSVVRKPRGHERHTGGTQMMVGDPLDRCITGWLVGKADAASCKRVSESTRPKADP